ncbi:MAG: hypothetical protein WCT12_04045 [Verrucomicrobiota bacterium]
MKIGANECRVAIRKEPLKTFITQAVAATKLLADDPWLYSSLRMPSLVFTDVVVSGV